MFLPWKKVENNLILPWQKCKTNYFMTTLNRKIDTFIDKFYKETKKALLITGARQTTTNA